MWATRLEANSLGPDLAEHPPFGVRGDRVGRCVGLVQPGSVAVGIDVPVVQERARLASAHLHGFGNR